MRKQEEVLLQLYTPADVFADLQVWCGEPDDPQPTWPDRAWYVLQGQVFGCGLEPLLPYLRFSNQRRPGLRLITYDAAVQRVCAVGLCEARAQTDWQLAYYFASPGARKLRVFEAALPTLIAWLTAQAQSQGNDVRLAGELACEEDGCRWVFAYRATALGRLWIEQDAVTCG